jgi:hypothetical protein
MPSVLQTRPSTRSGRLTWFAATALVAVGATTTSLPSETTNMSPLTVTLKVTGAAAVPGVDVVVGDPAPQLSVVIKNTSSASVRLWKDSCSFGYRTLSLDITDKAGKHFVVTRVERIWEKDFPAWDTLAPGATMSTELSITSKDWQGLPSLKAGERRAVRMHAVYHSAPEYQAQLNSVWVGSVASDDIDVTLLNPQK